MEKLNIVIIGGGAAGFFAAIEAKKNNPHTEITIIEKNSKLLAKVRITGGGRCNLTNSFNEISDLKQVYPRGHKLIKRLFKQFDYLDTYQWFEKKSIPLITQEDQCVFPKSQNAMSIVTCLIDQAKKMEINMIIHHKVTDIIPLNDHSFTIQLDNNKTIKADRLIITTGGLSEKEGNNYLRHIGHEIEHPIPSLFTFNIKDKQLQSLMGTVVTPTIVTIPSTKFRAEGPLLITHWGMSGPAILKLSSHAARYLYEKQYHAAIAINWINEPNHSKVETLLNDFAISNALKQLSTARPVNLPSRLWVYLLYKAGLNGDKKWSELGKKGQNKLIETLTNDNYPIAGKGSFKEEFVTCGGISLSSVDSNTLESKIHPNLYFAGEVLDIDAITGGFNLQAAWTTGYVAGKHATHL